MIIATAEKKLCPIIASHGNCTPTICMAWKFTNNNTFEAHGKFASGYCTLIKNKNCK